MKGVTGTKDYYPEEERRKQLVFATLKTAAEFFCFQEVNVPVIESYQLISKGQGEELRSQLFTLEKKGKEDLALRAEFTPSFARLYMQKERELSKPVKWFCIDKVWRYERPQKGRDREFYQLNVECYGSESPAADAEVVQLAISSLLMLGLKKEDLDVRVNNRKLLQGILLAFCKEKDMEEVMRIIDKKEKVDGEAFTEMLQPYVKDVKRLLTLLETDKLSSITVKQAAEGKKELQAVLDLVPQARFSPTTARGLAYYSGMVFEIFDKKGALRSICGGGRYDQLLEELGGNPTPAVGFGMGYSTLSLLLTEKGLLQQGMRNPEYFVAVLGTLKEAFSLVTEMRMNGKTVFLSYGEKNLSNQLKQANQMKARNLIIVGEEEVKKQKVKIKELATGKEKEVTFADIGSGKI